MVGVWHPRVGPGKTEGADFHPGGGGGTDDEMRPYPYEIEVCGPFL